MLIGLFCGRLDVKKVKAISPFFIGIQSINLAVFGANFYNS